PESENSTIVTSPGGSFDEAASMNRGSFIDHKAKPATVETKAPRNARRLGLSEGASRSRSDPNMNLLLEFSYFPRYKSGNCCWRWATFGASLNIMYGLSG